MKKGRYVLKRLVRTIPIVIGVTLVTFLILHLTPGDPVRIMLGPYATPENIAILRAQYGLDQPLPVQYLTWLGNIARGDFGTSIRYNRPVTELISDRIGITVLLTLSGLFISVTLGSILGILAALKQNSWLDYLCTFQAMFWISIPGFWLAIIFLYIFGLQLRWVPIAGLTGFVSLILPALTIGLQEEAWFARPMRAEMLGVLNEGYIKAARAKGVRYFQVVVKHALRNVMVPMITMLALRLPWVIAGSVVVEVVFAWGGMGSLLVNSVLARDYPVVQGVLLIIALSVVAANLFADLVYSLVDPRIRVEGGKK